MANFGAFCPLPLRLTPDTWSAAEQVRVSQVATAVAQASPFAVLELSGGASAPVVLQYIGRNGIGLAHAPSVTCVGSVYTVTWDAQYENELGDQVSIQLIHGHASGDWNSAISLAWVDITSPKTMEVTCEDATVPVTVCVFARTTRDITDYGGATDKADCETERTPYALQCYRQIQEGMGSAFSKELTGLVHAINLTEARAMGWLHRLAEKLGWEQTPRTSEARLEDWCALLKVRQPTSSLDSEARLLAGAAYQSLADNTPQAVDQVCADALDRWFVQCWRPWDGAISAPATPTHWPTINPGPVTHDLGGGTWLSAHARLTVEVVEPVESSEEAELYVKLSDLAGLLGKLLPSHMTWDWSTNSDDGFRLDYGRLDFEGLGSP